MKNCKKKYKYLYTNGSSFTAGGGLEIQKGEIQKFFFEEQGLHWDDPREVAYPRRLADKLGVELYDDSECGGGPERVIRMTYDYLRKGKQHCQDTLFILEFPTSHNRMDIWSNWLNKYLICNPNYHDLTDTNRFLDNLSITQGYYKYNDSELMDKQIKPELMTYLLNFHSIQEYDTKIVNAAVGLISLMLQMGVDFFVTDSGFTMRATEYYDNFANEYMFPFEENDLFKWSYKTGKTLREEMNGLTNDNHPGYTAHKEWAEKVYDYICEINPNYNINTKENLEKTII